MFMDKTSRLDLKSSERYDYLFNYKDEIGDMFKSINNMRSILRKVIENLAEVSKNVSDNTTFVQQLTEELKIYAEETTGETENMSSGMEETAATAEEISATSAEMGGAVANMTQKAEKGSRNSSDISVRASKLKDSSVNSIKGMKNIYNNVKNELEVAIEGTKSANKINELTEAILQITS